MEWKLISEKAIPSDEDMIMASFSSDVDDEMFSPSDGFLKIAYDMFNERFFNTSLPKVQLVIKSQPTKSYLGRASYVYDDWAGTIRPKAVTLNGAKTLTLHEWLEVVLHEMIHILDYKTNPHHFLRYSRRSYDAHGYWFMEQGRKYEQYGFHVQRYCDAEIGVNLQDNRVKSRIGKSVFLYMHGSNQRPLIMKMSRANLDRNIEYIVKRIGTGSQFGIGVNEIKVMSSQNPNIAMLKDLRMRNSYSRISWWWYDEKFEQKYGPFELEDTISVLNAKNPVNEDDDDNT